MIQIKNKQTVICTLDESSKIVQDMFASGLFSHIELDGGGELLDPTYLHHREEISLEYDDMTDIVHTLKSWVKDKIYVGTSDEDKLADNINYRKIDRWSVNVYGKNTDMTTFYSNCENLEPALTTSGIAYSRSMDLFPGDEMVFAEFTFTIPR